MNVRSSSLVLACAALLLAGAGAASAQVQPTGDRKKALALYEKGSIQYDLRHWKQAIELWMQAYEAYNAPEFLFNIAQAHRHEGNCEQALFFYRRFLATKPKANVRGEVENFIEDLEATCQTPPKPPPGTGGTTVPTPGPGATPGGTGQASGNGNPPRDGEAVESGGAGGGDEDTDAGTEAETDGEIEDSVEVAVERPQLFAVRVAGGPSFASMGDLEVGTLVSLLLGIGHPMYLGSVVLEPGVVVTYTPVPWEVAGEMNEGETKGTAGMTGLLGNAGLSFSLLPRLSFRADAGIGVLIFSGLTADGNPFLDDMQRADGPIPFFHARGALGVEYTISKNFFIHAQPLVVSYSPSPKLRSDIESIRRFEMLVGAGLSM